MTRPDRWIAVLRGPELGCHAGLEGQSGQPPNWLTLPTPPQAYFIDNLVPAAAVSTYLNGGAWAAGAMPMLAIYSLPNRDCGSFAAGGFGSGEAYRGWIDRVASQIGGGPVTIILEPDALDMADCLSASARQERFDLIRYGVDTLTRNPAAAVYVDAGHSRWLPADEIANRLNQVGIEKARGFSLNVSNFFTTDEEIGYGEAVSGMTGGKPMSSIPRATATDRPTANCTGATRAGARSASSPPPTPGTATSTRSCGSSVRVTPTGPAAGGAIRARATS